MKSAAIFNSSNLIRRRRFHSLAIVSLFGALALALCAAPFCAGLPKSAKQESRHEIDQLEDAWQNAMLKADIAALDSLLADDYMAITPNGTLQSKEQTLANMRSGATYFTSLQTSDRKVRFYGSTALVTSRSDVTGTTPGGDASGSYRYTRVYVKDDQGEWKIVSFEASKIREPAEKK
jgi:ketosteroid isomerase-like protein